jgi:four helix bundle protein
VLIRQIVASATSIGANIAEGHGRYTPGAHRHHLSIARGSAAETDSWLDLLRRAEWITVEDEALLHTECREIMAILTSKMRMLDNVARESDRVREMTTHYVIEINEAVPPFPFTEDDYIDDAR